MIQTTLASIAVLTLIGCGGTSALDKCTDSASYLWNPEVSDNRYEGNERYWDAVSACKSK